MKIFKTTDELRQWRKGLSESAQVGFVPTMGALHAGHAKLLQVAREQNEFLVLSVYVNQTQFNDPQDFAKYPKTWDQDVELAEACGVDVLFAPEYSQIYPDDFSYRILETKHSEILCGASRPGHFMGVLTIVMKLFQLVKPQAAYFGEKDFQQFKLIENMVKAFFLDIHIVPVSTVRESSGLALSSRNTRLSPVGKLKAAELNEILYKSTNTEEAKAKLEEAGFLVDYVEDHWGRRFAAVWLEGVRLIDNVSFDALVGATLGTSYEL